VACPKEGEKTASLKVQLIDLKTSKGRQNVGKRYYEEKINACSWKRGEQFKEQKRAKGKFLYQ